MEQISNHPRLSTLFDQNQIESLGENLDSLLEVIESNRDASNEVDYLGRVIASAAHAAEDVIESKVVDQIHAGFPENCTSFSIDLQRIIQEMTLVKEEVAEAEEARPYEVNQPRSSTLSAPSERHSSRWNAMVGFNHMIFELLDRLTDSRSWLEIIPIVGPGGIGKTTLAANCYSHPLIKEHFHICAWANVSQVHSVGALLLEIISFLIGSTDEIVGLTENQLGERLYKSLLGKRYLIVLDDMWSMEPWDGIRHFLPDNGNGSRIIITTRISSLASQFSSSELVMRFLDEAGSWNLFCRVVFEEKGTPSELEETGRMIVKYCKGLPLSITVIGGLLRNSPMTREYWRYVEENIGSILNSDDNKQMQNILMLSYNALPAYLKPCFLYLGVFPEGSEFRVSQIIQLWVAEGFLRPRRDQTLEEIAEDCIKELIDWNLILFSTTRYGKTKSCKMHDLLRDLCLSLADKEMFLSFVRKPDAPKGVCSERRFAVHDLSVGKYEDSQIFHAMESSLLARSIICESPVLLSFKSRLLRVLLQVYGDSLESNFQQINLRFLAYESSPIGWIPTYQLPPSISLLWNLQTLKIGKMIEEVVAPSEIWEMPQLRHLCFNRISLPEPPASDDDHDVLVLQNLQTLRTALNFGCSEEVCKRMPNIKKLRVLYDDFSGEGEKNSWYCIDHIGHFTRLESLHWCFRRVPNRDDLLQNLSFPNSLMKLILQDCELHWDDLSIISSLPNLKVLKLKCQSVRGPKWETVKGGFPSLRMLEIDSCYLIYWFSDFTHFPSLEELVLRRLYRLNEIPSDMGEIATLRNIYVVECSISAAISAARIMNEREDLYGALQGKIRFKTKKEVAEFTAKMKLEDLPYGLQIEGVSSRMVFRLRECDSHCIIRG